MDVFLNSHGKYRSNYAVVKVIRFWWLFLCCAVVFSYGEDVYTYFPGESLWVELLVGKRRLKMTRMEIAREIEITRMNDEFFLVDLV